MKSLIVALILAMPATATPYYQHPTFSQAGIQGELFIGTMRTNSGFNQETIAPVFYHNASSSDPWYHPSSAFVIGWNTGSGNASGGVGPFLDIGPQIIYGLESAVGVFSSNGKANVIAFFACSPTATACGSLSAGAIANGTFESGGQMTRTWKEFGAHPVGYTIGPSVTFGGPKAAP